MLLVANNPSVIWHCL